MLNLQKHDNSALVSVVCLCQWHESCHYWEVQSHSWVWLCITCEIMHEGLVYWLNTFKGACIFEDHFPMNCKNLLSLAQVVHISLNVNLRFEGSNKGV